MSRKMGPTAEFVGPTVCVPTQAVARPATLNLVHQLVRDAAVHARIPICKSAKTQWLFSVMPFWLLLLVMGISPPQLHAAVDTYTSEFEKSPQVEFYLQDKYKEAATVRQEQFRKRVSIRDAVGEDVPLAFSKGPSSHQAGIPQQDQDDSPGIVRQGILLVTLLILSLGLFTRILAPEFFKAVINKFNPWAGDARSELQNAAKIRAEDEAFGEFLANFQAGPGVRPATDGTDFSNSRKAGDEASEFQAKVGRLLTVQRSLLQDINRATEASAQRRMLADLGREMQMLKGVVSAPAHLPAWQLASALEGLLKQLSDKAGNVTRSTLRTVEGAVELLEELCQPGVSRDILTEPPVRFLAVDDDMICRTAVSLALKKAFNQPDLAENGMTALGMAARHPYDVIFLDVQMQGMDGFELCSKIHETSANKKTPVVFVTCLNDFDAHAQSVLTGGSDLLGKPFLTFEITVKALTLTLSRRLHSSKQPVGGPDKLKSATMPPADADGNSPKQSDDTDRQNEAIRDVTPGLADNLEHAFLTRAAKHLGGLREHIRQMTEATDENARQEALADFYLALHALTPKMDSAVSHPAMRLSAALEGLLKKLLENPQNWTSSALLTISNAVDLLDDLCDVAASSEFGAVSPLRMLVVDDDLVSRRAILGALQTAFGKPESAENGEAALALATEKTFDLIFLDIQMPGMDGFTTCTKIRQTIANRTTPVVFVSGQADFTARVPSATRGGNDLIAKPFLTSEVTLKALTLGLRSSLQKSITPNPSEKFSQEAEPPPARESKRARKRRLAR